MPRAQQIVAPDGASVRRKPVCGDLRWDGDVWRRWTGRRWAQAVYSLRPDRLRSAARLDLQPAIEEHSRQRALSLAVEDQVSTNRATVIFEGPNGVVLAYPRRVAHSFHAVMTLLTGGLWAVVWLALALGRRENRVRFEVDRWGNVWARSVAGT